MEQQTSQAFPHHLTDEHKATLRQTAETIATQLHETSPSVRQQIWRIIKVLGVDQTQTLADQAVALHAGAGMTTSDGARQRSVGGIFFVLVRKQISKSDYRYVFSPPVKKRQSQPPPNNPDAS